MKPILKSLADAYLGRYGNLSEICFLFPNKRSGTFFRNYLKEAGYKKKNPKILTISDFVKKLAGKAEADKLDQIFTLYKAYLHVVQKNKGQGEIADIDFDSFSPWGITILSDFNTVDQYMVDAGEIFKNVKDFREISTNFLNEEQKEVLKEYFGIEDTGDSETFWKQFEDTENSNIKTRFLNLWQILGELHEEFISRLAEKNQATSGTIYRLAADNLKEKGRDLLSYKKIVVFGFNALNGAEWSIFASLRDFPGYKDYDNYADFIWDATGPVLNDFTNSASRFIKSNKKHFPTAYWLETYLEASTNNEMPEIRIISSPSDTLQVKIASEVLNSYRNDNPQNVLEAETALVLPDESLLINTLYSLPTGVEEINLTMGYQLRKTGIATFFNLLRRLYANMRESGGKKIFFHKGLRLLLTHPYSYMLFTPAEIDSLLNEINSKHKISVELEDIKSKIKEADIVFDLPDKKEGGEALFNFINNLLSRLTFKLNEESEDKYKHLLETTFIERYRKEIETLRITLSQHGIKMSSPGILYQIDRLISRLAIGFEGEPLEGLQIMGTLETRGLDFKDVVILSMNEGMMPRRSRIRSFIPDVLRRGYHLPPARYSEEIFAYYFYRLISRAQRVTLIYDGRTGGGLQKAGESRYLLQLKHSRYKEKIRLESWNFDIRRQGMKDASIKKTKEIRELLKRYLSKGENQKNLSASSLNVYRECQVKFFLSQVAELNTDPDHKEFMDPITIGNIIHDTMMELYLGEKFRKILLKKPMVITKDFLENILKNPHQIERLLVKKINKEFYHIENEEDRGRPLPGSSEIIARQMQFQIEEIIRHDLTLVPFELFGCEIKKYKEITTPGGKTVNFKFAIDRLDRIQEDGARRLRIVDYKTGMRKREARDIEEVLEGNYKSEQVFQLFTYAWLLDKEDIEGKEDVRTEIYFVPDFVDGKDGRPVIGRKIVKSYDEYSEEFSEGLEAMIDSIFDDDYFKETKNPTGCLYCEFRRLCGK